ncbi:MAG: hypothetical protein KJ721_02375 [Nanoarchaeota archaeon]|nr:hypothetical protein [Nanoarchaeota archaeon]
MISNPVKDFAEGLGKGATEGLLNYGEEKLKELIGLFKDRKLRFIGDKRTIENARETKKSGEWAFYKDYIKDKELLFIIRLGLVLRRVEEDQERLQNLKEKIKKKYELKGLHIAYFAQNGLLNRYVGILLDNLDSPENLNKVITNTLNNIEKHTIFVDWRYTKRQLVKESITITSAHSSSIFIISGIGSVAKIVHESEEALIKMLNKYELEKITTGKKEILFFKRVLKK